MSTLTARSGTAIRMMQRVAHPVLGALIGLVLVHQMLGAEIFTGDPTYWLPLWGDAGTGLAALRYYLNEPWGFPLLHASGLNTPDGINLAFTDSLPLLAVTAKLLRPLGFTPEQWFGWWFVFLYMAQGASAVIAVRAFGVRSWTLEASVALIAVTVPILTIRTWHPGLAGQFTLLLAWALVGHLRHNENTRRVLRLCVALCLLTMLIHIYLLFGVALILGSSALGEVARGSISGRRFAGWLTTLGCSILVIGFLGGYLSSGASQANGYYNDGMHLMGPFRAQWSKFWPSWGLLPSDADLATANGSFEAMNWLGMGWVVVVLTAAAGSLRNGLPAARQNLSGLAQRYQLLGATMLILALYAITPVVRLHGDNSHDLRTPLGWIVTDRTLHGQMYGVLALCVCLGAAAWLRRMPDVLRTRPGLVLLVAVLGAWALSMLTTTRPIEVFTGQFRAAGRLFWPISYGLLIASVVAIWRWASPLTQPHGDADISCSEGRVGGERSSKTAFGGAASGPADGWTGPRWIGLSGRSGGPKVLSSLVLCCVAVIQYFDVGQFRTHAGGVLDPTPQLVVELAEIEALIKPFDSVHLDTELNCAIYVAGFAGIHAFQHVAIVASWELQDIDQAYAARLPAVDCSQPVVFEPGQDVVTIVVVAPGNEDSVIAPPGFRCEQLSSLVACSEAWATP